MPPSELSPPTEASSFRSVKEPHAEPISGYRLIEPMGSGGFGEVWKCEAPGGLLKAIKFVYGSLNALDSGNAPAEEERRAVQRVKAIRHPFLLSMERVECIGDELIIVMELADKNLHDLLVEFQRQGRAGIPREDLIGYMREAAEALDLLNLQYELQHLDIKPQNLFLVSNHVKVGDFGLVNSLGGGGAGRSAGLYLGAITPLYASPEIFQSSISRQSDQYSLAIVYQELLTGMLPFTGKNSRQLLMQHTKGEPDLGALPERDRPIVARALAKNPEARFPSCADFVQALSSGLILSSSVVLLPNQPAREHMAVADARPASGKGSLNDTWKINHLKVETRPVRLPRLPAGCKELAQGKLVRSLGNTPLTETWQAELPGGTRRLVKHIYGFSLGSRERDQQAVERLRALAHPGLVAAQIILQDSGNLVVVSEYLEKSLRDCFRECQADGLPGIPRHELIEHLSGVAEALDELAERHEVNHHWLQPRSLLLKNDQALIADFGLAHLLWLPAGQDIARLNGRYAAPELHVGRTSSSSDQYSLAAIYVEMLAGVQLPGRGAPLQPDLLGPLSEKEQAIVIRALHPDANRRWLSCSEFVQALAAIAGPPATAQRKPASHPVLAATSCAQDVDALSARFSVSLTSEELRRRLDGVREQWNGQVTHEEPDRLVLNARTPASYWQRFVGRRPALELEIGLIRTAQKVTELAVTISPRDCDRAQRAEVLKVIGPLMLETVRTHLQALEQRRAEERLTWHHPLQVMLPGTGQAAETIECQGKDLSLNGIGFYAPRELTVAQLRLHLPATAQTPDLDVEARIVRSQPCAEGWFEVGAVLLSPELGAALPLAGQPPAE
jgi:serine/threonine protein kinase